MTWRCIEGDPAEDRFVAAYGRYGRLVAALGMRRPARVMALQRLIAAGAPFPPPERLKGATGSASRRSKPSRAAAVR